MAFPIHQRSWGRLPFAVFSVFEPFSPRRRHIFTCLGVVCLMVFVVMSLIDEERTMDPEPAVRLPEDTSVVTMLLWSHPFGQHSTLSDCLERHQLAGCRLTDDRLAYREADAVIFHHRDVLGATALPKEPRPGLQKWIWMNYESPSNTPNLAHFESIFNLTLTYRMDSDIFLPYGFLIPNLVRNASSYSSQYLQRPSASDVLRPRLLAWVVSNWSESHRRVSFFRQLRRYLPVDVYGRVGQPLEVGVVELLRDYQFYLAMENSEHTDYITEKLWNPIEAGAIPVVLGPTRKNYERFLPPEAFIHVDDFASAKELALYLLMLRRKPELLMSHLRWRSSYRLHRPSFWSEQYCMACRAVLRTRGQTKAVKDLARWFQS